jgi:hypothetical protein
VTDKRQVFAVGSKERRFGVVPLRHVSLVRAYDANSGRLLWHDEFGPPTPSYIASRIEAVAAEDGRVFAAGGSAETATGNVDLILRTYDAK